MPVNWNTIFSTRATADAADVWFGAGEVRQPLVIVRNARARNMRLRLDPKSGTIRLTLPTRAPLPEALKWVETKRGWVEAQIARKPEGEPIASGMKIPFGDRVLTLDWNTRYRRTPEIAGDLLKMGGPLEGLSPRLIRWLKHQALDLMTAETRERAAQVGQANVRVGVGDPSSRWGSCSSRSGIRYSWRLILAPEFVRRMIVAHEVAHLVHMNHGADFHRLELELAGEHPGRANRWLKANGASLHAFGRE
jgi:predicted metal-dependent hydrolase